MTDVQVRDEALTLFLAGHETTADALTWAWYLLSQNPEAEAAFHAELDHVLAGRLPSFDDLPRLRYTEGVFAEALRLYPPAWGIGRRALEDYPVGGFLDPGALGGPDEPVRGASRSALVFRSACVPSRALVGGRSGAAEVCVFPVWRRRAGVHRGALRVDGGHADPGGDRTALAAAPGARTSRGKSRADHLASETRDANDRRAALAPGSSRVDQFIPSESVTHGAFQFRHKLNELLEKLCCSRTERG